MTLISTRRVAEGGFETMPAIETSNLTKVYNRLLPGKSLLALDGLTMEVPEGKVFGYLGHNGAGKTTTLKVLLGLTHPTEGSARILGKPLGGSGVHHRIGYLPESPRFYGYLDASEFLDYSAKFYRMSRGERQERVSEMLDYVGLAESASRKLKSFSRGMLQRVGLAQAMLHDPDLLLLDEPMSGLDPVGRKQVKDLIKRLCVEEGKTVLFCSHVLSEVEQVCDVVAILSDGRLVVQDSLDELLHLQEVVMTLEGSEEELVEKLRHEGLTVEEKEMGRVTVCAPGEEMAERVRELLSEYDAECVRTEHNSESLEDFFLRTVSGTPAEV